MVSIDLPKLAVNYVEMLVWEKIQALVYICFSINKCQSLQKPALPQLPQSHFTFRWSACFTNKRNSYQYTPWMCYKKCGPKQFPSISPEIQEYYWGMRGQGDSAGSALRIGGSQECVMLLHWVVLKLQIEYQLHPCQKYMFTFKMIDYKSPKIGYSVAIILPIHPRPRFQSQSTCLLNSGIC